MRSCSALSRTSSTRVANLEVLSSSSTTLCAVRNHVDVGPGNDEFAHQVDELVELVGVHADGAAFRRTVFLFVSVW
jgi:hypothetical protein